MSLVCDVIRLFEGENGTGKTTFIRMLAGLLKSDEQTDAEAAGDEELAQSVRPSCLSLLSSLLLLISRMIYTVKPGVRYRTGARNNFSNTMTYFANEDLTLPSEKPVNRHITETFFKPQTIRFQWPP